MGLLQKEIVVTNVMRNPYTEKPIIVTMRWHEYTVSFCVKNGKLHIFSKFKENYRGAVVDIPDYVFREFCRKAAAIFFDQRRQQ